MRHPILLLFLFATSCDSCDDDPPKGYSIQVGVEGMGQVSDGDNTCAVAHCDWSYDDSTPSLDLIATAASGWHFDHWMIEKVDALELAPCDVSGESTPHLGYIPEKLDSDVPECRFIAVFVMDTGGGAGFAATADLPGTGGASIYHGVYLRTLGYVAVIGDQDPADPDNVLDAQVETIEDATTAHGVSLPNIEPRAIAETPDGVLVGGRDVSAFYAWLADLASDGAFSWQEQLGGDAEDISELATRDDGSALVVGSLSSNLHDYLASIGSAGDVTSVIDLGSGAFPSAVVATSDGGAAVSASQFNGGTRDSYVWKLDSAGAVDYQLHFSGGFVEIDGLAEDPAGGLFGWGRDGATGSTSDGYVFAVDDTGALRLQRVFGSGGSVSITSVFPTDTGLRAVMNGDAGLMIVDLDATATPIAASSLEDSEGQAGYLVDAFPTPDGGVAVAGGSASDGTATAIVTAPDLTIGGCADPGFGSSIDPSTIPSAAATATVAAATFTVTSVATFPTTPTTVTPIATDATPADLCVP